MISLYTIIFAAILPAFLLVVYIWLRDRYQREPISQILKGVAFGVVSAGIAYVLESGLQIFGWTFEQPITFVQAAWNAFVGAAMPEELAKLLMLWLLLRNNRYFDERFDGIVYAVCVGMGFAGTENILYLLSNINEWQSVAVGRAMFAVPGHFMFAVAMGYMYSMIYFGDMSWRKKSRIFWVPVLFHGVYDSILFMVNMHTIFSTILLLSFYVFCFMMFRYGKGRIREHLDRDSRDPNQIAFWK